MKHSEKICPLCQAKSRYIFSTKFCEVSKCSNKFCKHIFSSDAKLKQGIHEHDESNIALYTNRNKQFIHELKRRGLIRENSHVLDIGAGLGHISAELKRQIDSVKILCVEAAPASIQHLKTVGFDVIEDLKHVENQQFDFIFLVELIEHIDDPLGLMCKCKQLLSPGGIIFLSTPAGELRFGSHKTAAYDIPEHIHFFTKSSLLKLFQLSGFSNSDFLELPEFYSGPTNIVLKKAKDYARIARNFIFGKHHFIIILHND